jgi:hypothetical protein
MVKPVNDEGRQQQKQGRHHNVQLGYAGFRGTQGI